MKPSHSDSVVLSPGLCAQIACIWEVTARKPGNVHRYHDSPDSTYLDYLLSAAAIAPVLENAVGRNVGDVILDGVRATRRVVQTNTNLGIMLLLAPLATIPRETSLRKGVPAVLGALRLDDSRAVYEAIRLAAPSGLGRVSNQDVFEEPTQSLVEVMALAADRDLIARQYANGFQDVLGEGYGALHEGIGRTESLEGGIIYCHLALMAAHPDSLIARKRGWAEAEEARRGARTLLQGGWPHLGDDVSSLEDLDAWLRAMGNARNPGTTADLVTASLFVALREGSITVPTRYRWSFGETCPNGSKSELPRIN
jgi:triphosphoribosyl-dephospho-CoA synthase